MTDLQIVNSTPAATAIERLFERAQHIRFKKQALFYTVSSGIDSASGATNGRNAMAQDFRLDTSLSSHHGLIKIRDKSTRVLSETAIIKEPGEKVPFEAFDYRTIIAFRFPREINIKFIEGYIPNMGWVKIDLEGRRLWEPAPYDTNSINEFNELMSQLARVRATRALVKKQRDNGKKRSFMNGKTSIVGAYNNRSFTYAQVSGHTDKLFEKNGEEVSKERTIQINKEIGLISNFEFELENIPRAESPDDVAALSARYIVLGEVEKALSKATRRIELGLIEDFLITRNIQDISVINGMEVTYGSVSYRISLGNSSSYDYPEGTLERWKRGEIEMKNVPTKAQWRAKENKENAEEIEEELSFD